MQNYELLERGLILIHADEVDVAKFLQGIITNDMNLLKNQACIYSFMLCAHGKYLFDFFITKFQNGFLIDVDLKQKEALMKKLVSYRMRLSIIFIDLTDEFEIFYSSLKPHADMICYQDPRYKKLGWRLMSNKTDISLSNQKDIYIGDKFDFVIPDGFTDMLEGKSFPIEYGAEALNAISYTKGCYVGQEVVSRTKYQGMIRKQIMRASAKYAIPKDIPSRSEVKANNIKIGELCSFSENKVMLLIRKDEYSSNKDYPITLANDILLENFSSAPWQK